MNFKLYNTIESKIGFTIANLNINMVKACEHY